MLRRSSQETVSTPWGVRVAAGALVATVGYLGVGKLIDSLPFHGRAPHLPAPAETQTTTTESLSKVIARELEKTQKFQGDTKTYLITVDVEKRRAFKVAGFHVGDDVNRGTISTTGSTRGVVDFSGINETAINVAPDNSSVTIRLPHARLEDVSASHEEGVARTFYSPNLACQADLKIGQCPIITDSDLLHAADKKIEELVNNDGEILPAAESQTTDFLSRFINGIGVPLLYNQDPVHAPSHINVIVTFGDATNEGAQFQPQLGARG